MMSSGKHNGSKSNLKIPEVWLFWGGIEKRSSLS
jgi:hypothetical protein